MTGNPLQQIIEQQGVVVLDGALATELERRGADLRDDLWSARVLLENPQMIRRLHHDYFMAGADVAITASYQASFEGFMARGLSRAEAGDLMQLSVQLAREARDAFWAEPANRKGRVRPLVAASVGCYGAYLSDGSEYRGDYALSNQELKDWHRPRMATLLAAEPDLLALETIPLKREGEALLELLAEFPRTSAWLSFSCCDASHVCHGEPFVDCVRLASQSEQIVAVGLNCTPPHFVTDLLHAASATVVAPALDLHEPHLSGKPLLAYPNSGETWDSTNQCWIEGTGVTRFAEPARVWRDAGARIVGGCCRTSPKDIRAIRRSLLGPQQLSPQQRRH